MKALHIIRDAINAQGLDKVTSTLLKQSNLPYPEEWNLKTAALCVTLKIAENRLNEQLMRKGIASYIKVIT